MGQTLSLSGETYVVVGVVGNGFNSEQFDREPEIWIPYQMDPNNTDGDCYCRVVGRLNPRVTLATANAQLAIAGANFNRAFPGVAGLRRAFGVQPVRDAMIGDVRPLLLILAAAVGFVLLIACTNVANLLLIRANARQREIAVRAFLGAGRGRLIRQLLTESIILFSIGGAIGLALGVLGIRAILRSYPSNPLSTTLDLFAGSRIGEQGAAITLDWRILCFTFLVSLLTGVLFGLIPALSASRIDLLSHLKQGQGSAGGGVRQSKTRSLLVISQFALASILLIGASLLIRSIIELETVNPGFDFHNVLVMQMSLAGMHFEKTAEIHRLVGEGVKSIHSVAGVTAAATACCLPLETVWQNFFIIQGRPLTGRFHGVAGWTFVSPEYFEAFRIPILRGRSFTERDDASAPGVVLINETMAQALWPKGDPLSDRLLIGRGMRPEYEKDPVRQIVGIVGDVRAMGVNRKPRPEMYVPIAQLPDGINGLNLRLLPVAWIVRTIAEPHSLAVAVEEQLRKSTGQPLANIRSMKEVTARSTARSRLNTLLMTIFGGCALLLAGIGIYGVIASSVQQRSQEIGIRIALGAEASNVRNMMLVYGMRLNAIGLLTGVAGALALMRLISGLLFGVKPWDPTVFVCVPLVLTSVALFATWLPARRAMRIDAIVALRHE